jgi:hypothetical protein
MRDDERSLSPVWMRKGFELLVDPSLGQSDLKLCAIDQQIFRSIIVHQRSKKRKISMSRDLSEDIANPYTS